MFKKLLLSILCLSTFSIADINIAVAANVSYAIDDLVASFNKTHKDIKVNVTLSSSGKLTAQIKHNAPFDIFMSANMKYPNSLYKDGLSLTKPIVYAQGSLSFLSSKKLNLEKGIDLLKENSIKKIAIANPKTAPYGKASVEAFKNADIYDEIKSKLLYAQTISQTVTYTLNGADIGIVAKSTLFSPKMAKYKNNAKDVNVKLYTPINQGIIVLKNTKHKAEAKAFYNFILSEEAKAIFRNFGYLIPYE